jgi:hypothetical protein
MEQKNEQIKKSVSDYCNKHLDEAYLKICTKVHQDLLKKDKKKFARGKSEIWAASVIWAVGGENFLSDKSFEPYATLSDVCTFFNVNSSTVGQKSRKIKDILDINLWNPKYRLPGSELGSFLDSLVMTENGIIVPQDMLEDDESDREEIETVEEEASPEYYLLFFKPIKKVPIAQFYQLEYTVKRQLEKDEHIINSVLTDEGELRFVFFGWWDSVEKIQKLTENTGFTISDIYYADNAEALLKD